MLMIQKEEKELLEKYIQDEWSVTDEQRKHIQGKYLLWSDVFCNGKQTTIIERNTSIQLGKYFEGETIKWY